MSVERKETRPRAILIENASANGSRTEFETTVFSRDDGIKVFLDIEARKAAKSIESLERKLLTLSRKKPSGKLRALRDVSQIKVGIEEEINQMRANKGVLEGRGNQPIKIKMVDRQIVGWEHPHGGDDKWVHYVVDEHPEILKLSTKEISLLQRTFMIKHALKQGKRGAANDYEELLHDLRDSDPERKLAPYLKEISQRLLPL